MAELVKNPPAMWDTWVQSLSWEDPLEKRKAIHSSVQTWRIPWGHKRVGHDWATFTFTQVAGLHSWHSGKESSWECRGWEFDPWVGKILFTYTYTHTHTHTHTPPTKLPYLCVLRPHKNTQKANSVLPSSLVDRNSLPDPGIELGFPTLRADFLPAE